MGLEVNGAAILATIAANPSAFGLDETQLNTLAVTTMLARLKDKTLSLDQLRLLAQAIGPDDFRLVLDHLVARDAAALAKRMDAKNKELTGAEEAVQRSRIIALSEGSEPVTSAPRPTKQAKASKSPSPQGTKTGDVMKSKAQKASRKKVVP